jgi:glycogen synthase
MTAATAPRPERSSILAAHVLEEHPRAIKPFAERTPPPARCRAKVVNPASLRVAVLAATCLPWHRPGGLERHVFELCRWLRRRDVGVHLFTSQPERDVDPFVGDPGFRLEVVPGVPFLRRRYAVVLSRNTLYPLFSLRMGSRVVREARRSGFSAVIAQGLTGFGYAVHAARRGVSAPLILNPQGMEETITPNALKRAAYLPFRQMTRHAARAAAAVVATDRVLLDTVERVFGTPRSRIVVIPNAIDVNECRSHVDVEKQRRIRDRLDAADASPLIVTVGRLVPNKGLDIGLEALARVAANLPPSWRYVMVGDGPLRDELARVVARVGLGDHVRLAGNLDDSEMHNLVAVADLFLNPTLYEGSSLVTLEAMSHGCAIVASRAGGIPDKIEEGVTGWLAEPGDVGSLADGILRWWRAGEETRSRIRRAAAERCRERFDWPICVDRYLEVIRRC